MFDDLKNNDSELRNVRVLAASETLKMENVTIPDEVPVYASASADIGRARLSKKDDGVYADITLWSGGASDSEASAIGHVTQQNGESRFEVTGVGLTMKVATVALPIPPTPIAKTLNPKTPEKKLTEPQTSDNQPGLGG